VATAICSYDLLFLLGAILARLTKVFIYIYYYIYLLYYYLFSLDY